MVYVIGCLLIGIVALMFWMERSISQAKGPILSILDDGLERSGYALRKELESHGHKVSVPAFYHTMYRLEDESKIAGRLVDVIKPWGRDKERRYTLKEQA